jgi:uncharacterized membrane protein YjjP (DUF1212 family)
MMPSPKEPAYPASALHRIRLSQLPLSSLEPALVPGESQAAGSLHAVDFQPPALEKPGLKESLRHSVRYNIVGELRPPFWFYWSAAAQSPLASHHYRKFLLKLAHALMQFGAPMHKIDEQLSAAAQFFGLDAQFILLNTVIIAVFRGSNGSPSQTHFIQRPQGLSLAQLRNTHVIYDAVVHDEISAVEGAYQLTEIMNTSDTLGRFWKVVFAFLAGASICPIGFSGSVADSLVAGILSAILQWIQVLGEGDVLFVGIFECVCLHFFLAALLETAPS